MARYMPPIYKMVRRKVAPTPAVRPQVPQETQNILQKQKELAEAVRQQNLGLVDPVAAEKEAKKIAKKVKAKAKRSTKKSTKKATKKATKKKATKKKSTKKFPKWSPDDNRDKLYNLAKKLGLEMVKSRDTKSWIIKELKTAERKASK